MPDFVGDDLFAGLSGIELSFTELQLGDGVILRRTFAHLMAPFMMAFVPAAQGKPHTAPWKTALGGLGFDIHAELFLPKTAYYGHKTVLSCGHGFASLMRICVSPHVSLPVISTVGFSSAANLPDNQTEFLPVEVEPRRLVFEGKVPTTFDQSHFEWIINNWRRAFNLKERHTAFRLAMNALDEFHFGRSKASTLVSMWGALEALFSSNAGELRFRVSSLIAAYLEPSGTARFELKNSCMELYNTRSKMAHGSDECDNESLLRTYFLLRRVVLEMIKTDHIPNREELERRLFGAT